MGKSKLLLTVLAVAFVFTSCIIGKSQMQSEKPISTLIQMGTFEGESKALGNGMIHSWVKLGKEGNPSSLGVTFTESALKGLPKEPDDVEYTLSLPKGAASTAFNHIAVDWNPKGHEPKGIYDKPHFDFHFYMMSLKERDKITATKEDNASLSKKPESGYIPEGYVSTPGGVPRMGAHWIDPKAPEFNGQPFAESFIYGFYNGEMVFVEPMVTVAFLKTRPKVTKELKLPKCYPESAYFPTSYSVRYDESSKEYTIALEGLTPR